MSTANTWSARQTFNGGITGALAGNADTATKLKTARNINGVRFDGSADININTLVSRGRVTALGANAQGTSGIQLYEAYNNGYPSPYGNVLHLKGATAAGEGELFIGWSGTSGAHAPVHIRSRRDTDSANWSEWAQVYTSKDSIPGVNAKGDQDTSGNAATATRLQTARTINGVSFDGSKNIELTAEDLNLEKTVELAAGALQKNQNGADIPDKRLFLRNIGTTNSTTMSFSGGAGWFKLATVTMPQASSVVYISLIGGAGYNVNSPMQAGISELVLRAGNGNPKGLTGALWRRTSVGFTNFAWVNTSGDIYDVYVEIGNYATGVNIQWDYTSNASVTIHTSPTYTANKPTGLTDGTVYVIYSSHIKPTAADVGALSLSGGQLNGALGIGTPNVLGGNSIVLGDNDTGFKQNGDGLLDVYANSQHVFRFQNGVAIALKNIQAGNAKKLSLSSSNTSTKNATFNLWGNSSRPVVAELGDDSGWHFYSQRNTDNSVIFSVNGQIQPSNWGNIDSRYVKDVRLGSQQYYGVNNWQTWNFQCPSGHVLSGINVQDTGSNSADNIAGVYYRPIQKYINGTWYNVASV
ncbi:phage tail protein [Escherichia coli]|nr:phage tail protein [Escherichia coli]